MRSEKHQVSIPRKVLKQFFLLLRFVLEQFCLYLVSSDDVNGKHGRGKGFWHAAKDLSQTWTWTLRLHGMCCRRSATGSSVMSVSLNNRGRNTYWFYFIAQQKSYLFYIWNCNVERRCTMRGCQISHNVAKFLHYLRSDSAAGAPSGKKWYIFFANQKQNLIWRYWSCPIQYSFSSRPTIYTKQDMTSHTEYSYTFIHHVYGMYKSDNIITEFSQYGSDVFNVRWAFLSTFSNVDLKLRWKKELCVCNVYHSCIQTAEQIQIH